MIDSRILTFITVAKTRNFTKAAEILNITQPGVYQQIQFLENYYGTKFIEREGRLLKLTKEGEFFLQYAKEIRNISSEMERGLRSGAPAIKRHNIAATLTIGGYVVPPILGAYKTNNPNISIDLHVDNTNIILKKLIDREVELALIEGPFDKTKFKYKKFKNDELVLAVSSKHEFANKKCVTINDVLKGNLLLREHGSGTREIFEGELITRGYSTETLNKCMSLGNINAIISLVELNTGYTIISKEAVKNEMNQGKISIVSIDDFYINREFNFVYLYDKEINFINNFIDFCCKYE